MNNTPYIVIQTTHAPYSTSYAVDALEAAMAATNVGLKVVFIFMHEGVFQLLSSQQPALISHKNIAKRILALPLFDVEDIFVQRSALMQFDIDMNNIKLDIELIDNHRISDLCKQAEHVLVF